MKIIPYDILLRDDAERVLEKAPESICTDISELLYDNPKSGFLAYRLGVPVGVCGVYRCTGESRASLSLFVTPDARGRGAGSALLAATEKKLASESVRTVYTDFLPLEQTERFLIKRGYAYKYSSDCMEYRGGRLPVDLVPEKYTDAAFEAFIAAEAEAFIPIRERTGAEPVLIPATEGLRSHLAEYAENYRVFYENGRLVAGCGFTGCEIDDVFVSRDCRSKGLAKALVSNAVNMILERGKQPLLWVVSFNKPAVELYRSLGFTCIYTHKFYTKTILA